MDERPQEIQIRRSECEPEGKQVKGLYKLFLATHDLLTIRFYCTMKSDDTSPSRVRLQGLRRRRRMATTTTHSATIGQFLGAILFSTCLPTRSCLGLLTYQRRRMFAPTTRQETIFTVGSFPDPGGASSTSYLMSSSWLEASSDIDIFQDAQVPEANVTSSSTHARADVAAPSSGPSRQSSGDAEEIGVEGIYQPFFEGGRGDPLSVQSFNMDLQNLADDNPQRAQDALEVMRDLYRNEPNNTWTIDPDVSSHRTVMEGWIQVGRLEKAQAVLDAMEDTFFPLRHNATSNGVAALNATSKTSFEDRSALFPNEMLYLSMIQAWSDDTKDDFSGKSAERAEALLRRIQNRIGLEPNVKLWTMVLEGWCKRAGMVRGAMSHAEALLAEMEANPSIHPNVLTYTSFIGGLGRSKEKDKARKAETVLDRMQRCGVEPDMVAYTSVINCWAKSVSRRERELAASRSLRILNDMERSYISKEMYHVKPSLITYNTIISAIGNSLDPNAPEMALDILKRMYALHDSGSIANLKPTTSAYNAVIFSLSRAPMSSRLRYSRRAEQVVVEMMERGRNGEKDVQPDVRTWATLLRAWAQCGCPDGAENAQRVLDKLEDLYARGVTNVRPNYVCYTTVMGAWGRSRKKGALDQMESILKRMEQKYEETLEADIRPNTVSYVTAIDAYVRRSERDAAQRAQATVDRMMKLYSKGLGHVRPTRIVFNTLIHAWSKSGEKGAAAKAEKIFKWMEVQYREGDELVRPDEVSMCAVLNAWANQAENGGAERAQQIWEYAESMTLEERGFPQTIMMPNIVIKAIARSKDTFAVQKAEGILLRLESDYRSNIGILRPDVTTISSVINACAYYNGDAEGRKQALDAALRTFNKLSGMSDEYANNITYGTIFKAIANLMPGGKDRDSLVQKLLDQCTEEGLVDAFVLSQVRNASPQLYRDLVNEPCGLGGPDGDDSIESVLRNIPHEWSANVVDY
jgi:pentatricopeptide repeat protein